MNYYLRKSGVVSGPFPEEDIRRRITLNLVTSMDEASVDGRAWKRIRQTSLWSPPSAAGIVGGIAPLYGRSVAPTTPAALHLRREAKRTMGRPTNAAPTMPPLSQTPDSSAVQKPVGFSLRSTPDTAPVYHERRRFGNWWLALAIPCATIVVLAIIGAFVGEDSSSAGSGRTSGFADDGYRGEEITTIVLDDIKPEFHDFLLYVTPSYAELKQTFQMVVSSDLVSDNLQYSDIVKDVHFYHDPSNDEINAFATVVDQWHHEGSEEIWPSIMVCGGAGRFARVIGAALTEFGQELDIDELLAVLGSVDSISNDQANWILTDALKIPMNRYSDPAWSSKAKSLSRGILMSILAHETGHVALGHVWTWKKNTERSRNQEREADSFAHSIASGTADAETMFFGNYLFHYAYAINEERNGDSIVARTHPYSEERLFNLIRDNQSIADLYGISERETLEQLRRARSKMK